MVNAFNGDPDREPRENMDFAGENADDSELSPLIHRVSTSDRKEDIERVGGLFDADEAPETGPQSSVAHPKAQSVPQVSKKESSRRTSRKDHWNERRARRNQRAEQIQRRQTADRTHARRKSNWRQNLVAFIFFLATIGALVYFAVLWTNPQSPLNFLPPPTPLPLFVTATPQGIDGEAIVDVPAADIRFTTSGEATYRAHVSCDYASIAGNVNSNDGAVYAVRITGAGMDSGVFSGSMLEYGHGGFEFEIANTPIAEVFTVQLFTTNEIPVSEPVEIITRATCEENVAFVQFREGN